MAISKITGAGVATDTLEAGDIADDAITSAEIAPNITLTGDYVGIPSATTTERDALTAAVGMLIYNSTLGMLQQYNAAGWTSIDAPPTLSSFTYPSGTTALDPAGSTTATLVLTGSNFSVGATVTIDSSAPTAVTRDSITQITITGYPAKAAATYAAGLKVTNASGLSSAVDIAYDAVPAWTTAAGSLGSFVDGAYTNSSSPTIRIVAAEGSDTIDYAQTNSAGVVNTDGVAGLVLGTTGANAGYLTGTLSGDESSTYNFYAKAQDDEGQFSAVRLFNIISTAAATGGTITTYSGYRVHTFLIGDTGDPFTVNVAMNVDYLVVAGGGGSGTIAGGGGGGAGGFRTGSNFPVTAQAYTITVGAGGAIDNNGGNSIFSSITSTGGGHGGPDRNNAGAAGGSGGGGTSDSGTNAVGGAASPAGQGNAGGISSAGWGYAGGGGGGAGEAGNTDQAAGSAGAPGGGAVGGAGGDGLQNAYRTGSNVWYAGGGAGGTYSGTGGPAGEGGGGAANADGTAGTGGGGGGNNGPGSSSGGAGGSGIVVIRYAV